MNGAAAVADALLRYTDRQYTVPGYPVTGLGALTGAELVINEKTALEYALGDSLSGKRAAVIVKNVGVNACADPLLQATVQGLIAGVVLVAGDDPDAEGSQTAQDTRYYGELAELPVIEPGASTCYAGIEAALEASEQFSRVAMIRLIRLSVRRAPNRAKYTTPRPGQAWSTPSRSCTTRASMSAATMSDSTCSPPDLQPGHHCWRVESVSHDTACRVRDVRGDVLVIMDYKVAVGAGIHWVENVANAQPHVQGVRRHSDLINPISKRQAIRVIAIRRLGNTDNGRLAVSHRK